MTTRKDTERLAAILIKAGLIDELQLRSAMARLGNWGGRLPRVLSELGFADEDEIMIAIGKASGHPLTHLGNLSKDQQALNKVGVDFCEEHCVFPVTLKDRVMSLAMVDPSELDVVDAVKVRSGTRVQTLLASETEIRNAILKHYRGQEPKAAPKSRARTAFKTDVDDDAGTDLNFAVDMSSPPKPERATTQETLRKSAGVAFTQQDLVKLEAARANQSKTATILRAVEELLAQKGVTPPKR